MVWSAAEGIRGQAGWPALDGWMLRNDRCHVSRFGNVHQDVKQAASDMGLGWWLDAAVSRVSGTIPCLLRNNT